MCPLRCYIDIYIYIFSHGEERVFEIHLRLGPVFGSLGLRDLPICA